MSNSSHRMFWFSCLLITLSAVASDVPRPAAANDLHSADEATKAKVSESYGKLPLSFEINRGQIEEDVRFLSRGAGYSLLLSATEARLNLRTGDALANISMKFVGANPSPKIEGLEEQSSRSNYLIGNDRSKWRTGIANYTKVRYRELYLGIDLVFYGNQRQFEYDFVVKPGADPSAIKIDFDGAENLKIDRNGDLVLGTSGGETRQRKPVLYQEVNETKRMIPGRYVIAGKNLVGFEVGPYDKRKPLVIDPVMVYSTIGMGGGSIAVDSSGNAYVVGATNLADFPLKDPLQNQLGGGVDVYIAKLNATGTALIYSTYFGGEGRDVATAIAVDAEGNAYVAGNTESANLPGAGKRSHMDQDAFVVKLNATGSAIVYSRYIGGGNFDECKALVVSATGQAYLTGVTQSPDFPITPNALKSDLASSFPQQSDAFITGLSDSGAITYSTYLGGLADDSGKAIALDSQGNVYVTGETMSTEFPVKGGLKTQPSMAFSKAFVSKLNPNQSGSDALVFSFTLRGTTIDIGVDSAGSSYILSTGSPDIFPTAGAYQSASGPAFLAKLNPAGSEVIYGTFLGGFGSHQSIRIDGTFTEYFRDAFFRMAVDVAGNIYLTGMAAYGTRFVTTDDAIQRTQGNCGYLSPHTVPSGCGDAIVMKLNAAGALVYSSFLGGDGDDDSGRGIAVDASGAVYVTGATASRNFPTSSGALPQTNLKTFITKISLTKPVATLANVSAASYEGGEVAPAAIIAAFGLNLATKTEAAIADPLPTSLDGTTVKVRDSQGMERLAPLFFVSKQQVNYQMHPEAALGDATVSITSSADDVSTGVVKIANVAPGMFTADASGKGLPAALAQRIRDNTTIAYEPIARFDAAQNRLVPIPIDLGLESDQVYLVLFCTGLRHRSALEAVTVTIGGVPVAINYAGPQLQLVGLDQINALLPRSLAGRGLVNVLVTVDGKVANTVTVSFK